MPMHQQLRLERPEDDLLDRLQKDQQHQPIQLIEPFRVLVPRRLRLGDWQFHLPHKLFKDLGRQVANRRLQLQLQRRQAIQRQPDNMRRRVGSWVFQQHMDGGRVHCEYHCVLYDYDRVGEVLLAVQDQE